MTFIGKILVVVIVILSVCVAAFTGGAHAFHESWKAEAEQLQSDLETARADYQATSNELKKRITDLKQERDEAVDDFKKAQGQLDNLQRELAALGQQLKDVTTERDVSRDEIQLAQQQLGLQRKEIEELNGQLREMYTRIDQYVETNTNLRDRVDALQQERTEMVKKHNALLEENSLMRVFIAGNDLTFDPIAAARMQEPPPLVVGEVLNTSPETRGQKGLVEISLGSDDGLAEGHELEIYREANGGRYIGRIKLVYVTPDRAVGTVVGRAKNTVIQRGDHVTTRL